MNLSILYGFDDNYAPYAGVSMTSLFENNQDAEEITVYLAALNVSQDNLDKFHRIAEQYGRKLALLETSQAIEQIKAYHCETWNGSLAAWLRLFVLDQIPDSADYLIYLDSDTIIYNGLSGILDSDLSAYPIAAVYDCLSFWSRFQLNFTTDESYYNAGVIVFNLNYWRKNNVILNMMSHLKENIERYSTLDQDLINDYFHGQILTLPPQYNVQSVLYAYSLKSYYSVYPWTPGVYYTSEELRNALDRPVVLHFFRFLGDYPWQQGTNYHPAKSVYESWKQKTLWKSHKGAPPKKELVFRLEKILYRCLPRGAFLRLFSWYTNRSIQKPSELRNADNIK